MEAGLALGLLVIGLVAGVASGMFGIGGGVIIVPALTLFLAFEPLNAIATSLAALLLPVGILAVIAYGKLHMTIQYLNHQERACQI